VSGEIATVRQLLTPRPGGRPGGHSASPSHSPLHRDRHESLLHHSPPLPPRYSQVYSVQIYNVLRRGERATRGRRRRWRGARCGSSAIDPLSLSPITKLHYCLIDISSTTRRAAARESSRARDCEKQTAPTSIYSTSCIRKLDTTNAEVL